MTNFNYTDLQVATHFVIICGVRICLQLLRFHLRLTEYSYSVFFQGFFVPSAGPFPDVALLYFYNMNLSILRINVT